MHTTTTADPKVADAEIEATDLIVGAGQLRQWFAAHPQAAADAGRHGLRWLLFCFEADEYRDRVRDLMDGAPLGAITKDGDDTYQKVTRTFAGGLEVQAYTSRDQVCERIVTGTETVEVPDPDAPMVTIEREVVEWRCTPILDVKGSAA